MSRSRFRVLVEGDPTARLGTAAIRARRSPAVASEAVAKMRRWEWPPSRPRSSRSLFAISPSHAVWSRREVRAEARLARGCVGPSRTTSSTTVAMAEEPWPAFERVLEHGPPKRVFRLHTRRSALGVRGCALREAGLVISRGHRYARCRLQANARPGDAAAMTSVSLATRIEVEDADNRGIRDQATVRSIASRRQSSKSPPSEARRAPCGNNLPIY